MASRGKRKAKHWGKVALVVVAIVAGWEWAKGHTKVGKTVAKKQVGSVY